MSPEASLLYSGMLPGVVAGHYSRDEAEVALPPLAARARARFVRDRVTGLDLATRVATCAGGAREPFDLLSIDVGAAPDRALADGTDRVQPVRPLTALLDAWDGMQADAAVGARARDCDRRRRRWRRGAAAGDALSILRKR